METDRSRLGRRIALAVVCIALGACEATYVDLRPQALRTGDSDNGFGTLPPTGGDGPDAMLLLEATMSGRGGYSAQGTAQVLQWPSGQLEVLFSDDFQASNVPGPVVLLSTRSSIGSSISAGAGDINLGTLTANSGTQRYAAPMSADAAQYVWIYCEPFGVEIARGELMGIFP